MTNNERYPFNDISELALIEPGVIIGRGNTVGPGCYIGGSPEWRGKEDHKGQVCIGDNNRITGLVTIDSGAEGATRIDNNCYIMKGVHIGHDAHIGDHVTLSCHSIIGGHTVINDHCNIGLSAVIHQKQIIAPGCMIGMGTIVTKKLQTEPFKTYAGNPAKLIGDNTKHPNYPEYTINMKDTI